jgi:hypothetical protein
VRTRLAQNQSVVIEHFAADRAEAVAAARYFRNDAVTLERIAKPGQDRLRQAAVGKRLLVIQDTTEINLTRHSGRLRYHDPHLGPVTKSTDVGFFAHPSLVLDASTHLPLGLSGVHLWNRSWQQPGKHARRYWQQPTEQKESHRWITSSTQAQDVLSEAAHVLIIADREGDFYEWLARVPDAQTDLLVRSRDNRRIVAAPTADTLAADKLYDHLAAQPCACVLRFEVGATTVRSAREATAEVRLAAVTLRRPRRAAATLPETLSLWAVEVSERPESVPPGEEPVQWRLLTTQRTETAAEASEVIEAYRARWRIEQLFRTLKSQGLDMEASQLRRGAALQKLCLMALEVSVEVMQLVEGRSGSGTRAPASLVFSAQEQVLLGVLSGRLGGRTERSCNPYEAGTLGWGSWVIGRLGGWKSHGSPPGPVRMSRGLHAFRAQFAGWQLAQEVAPDPSATARYAKDVCGG